MKLSNWKSLFAPHILKRGEAYYQDELVSLETVNDDEIQAVVSGSELYDVDIWLNHGRVEGMDCTCPYAEGGEACKHMAAVFYALEDIDSDSEESGTVTGSNELRSAVAKLNAEEARELLLELAGKSQDAKDFILLRLVKKLPSDSLNRWHKTLTRLEERYADRSGYVDYEDAYAYMSELEELLDSSIPTLVENGLIEDAFERVCEVYETAKDTEMDDSDGGLMMLFDCCGRHWETILKCAEQPQQEELHNWFQEQCEDDEFGIVEDFMFQFFTEDSMLKRNLAYIDKKLSAAENEYRAESYALNRIKTMEKLGHSREEIESFAREYDLYSRVRGHMIERAISEERYEDAIKLLQESKERDRDTYSGIASWSKQLIALYGKLGRKNEQREELLNYLLNCYQSDLDYVMMLKELSEAETWPETRDRLIASASMASALNSFLESEGLYDRLMENLRRKGSIYELDRYLDTLLPYYPDELLSMNLRYLREAMRTANNRKQYYSVIQRLKTLRRFKEGQLEAQRLTQEWRTQYPRRRSMIDELKQAGY